MSEPVNLALLAAAQAGDEQSFQQLTEPYRRELLVHCYRLLGSLDDAEDLVQETYLRAWRSLATFVRPDYFRAWLYKIATNASLNELARQSRRVLPNLASPPSDATQPLAAPVLEPIWLQPFPDGWLPEPPADPEARYAHRERISLAFTLALQLLPPRQRAVLILCDVLDWPAGEAAELLEMTVSAVNSALHRARETLAENRAAEDAPPAPTRRASPAADVLEKYVQAIHNADVGLLVTLLKDAAVFSMPPIPTWFQGNTVIGDFLAAGLFAGEAAGRWRLAPTGANGQPAFGLYAFDPARGDYQPFAVQVLAFEPSGEKIAEIISFGDARLFLRFSLPPTLPRMPSPSP